MLADLNFSIGIPIQAVRYYENMIAKKEDIRIYEKIVNAYLTLYNYDKALETVERAIKFHPDNSLLMIKGRILIQKKLQE